MLPRNRQRGGTAAELRAEYRFGDVFWFVSPFIGVEGNQQRGVLRLWRVRGRRQFRPEYRADPERRRRVFLARPGTNLGSWWEFRSGAELAWRFEDMSRLGVAVHHTSNGGLTKRNPGEQSVLLMYSVPLR